MNTKRLHRSLLSFAAFAAACILIAGDADASDKKGIAIGRSKLADDAAGAARIEELGVAWYYTWNTMPMAGAEAEFVPMIWAAGSKMEAQVDRLDDFAPVCELLAFNEPDHAKQSDMSVDEAIGAWDALRPLARRLGSPAAANALGEWFSEFDAEMAAEGKSYDFAAVHWYGAPSPDSFLRKIDDVYATYGKPIWITEFAVADWAADAGRPNRYTVERTIDFMERVLPELEKRPHVERYAWTMVGLTRAATATSRLYDANGELTALGKVYARFEGDSTLNVPQRAFCSLVDAPSAGPGSAVGAGTLE